MPPCMAWCHINHCYSLSSSCGPANPNDARTGPQSGPSVPDGIVYPRQRFSRIFVDGYETPLHVDRGPGSRSRCLQLANHVLGWTTVQRGNRKQEFSMDVFRDRQQIIFSHNDQL